MRKWLRYLRIAFSVVCGIACVLAIMLWVRSYWWYDIAIGKYGSLSSLDGCITCCWREDRYRQQVTLFSQNLHELHEAGSILKSGAKYGFIFRREPQALHIGLPHWLLALAATGLAAAPRIRWRFSLRTVLIAMTLIAAVLGLIVYATRG